MPATPPPPLTKKPFQLFPCAKRSCWLWCLTLSSNPVDVQRVNPQRRFDCRTKGENKNGTRHAESFIQTPQKHRLSETHYVMIILVWKQISGAVCGEVSGIPPGLASVICVVSRCSFPSDFILSRSSWQPFCVLPHFFNKAE